MASNKYVKSDKLKAAELLAANKLIEQRISVAKKTKAAARKIINTINCAGFHSKCSGYDSVSNTCCVCSDNREYSIDGLYNQYIDGVGNSRTAPRYLHYCPNCKTECIYVIKK